MESLIISILLNLGILLGNPTEKGKNTTKETSSTETMTTYGGTGTWSEVDR